MEIEDLASKVDSVIKLLTSINKKLADFVIPRDAKVIVDGLKAEELYSGATRLEESPIEKVKTTEVAMDTKGVMWSFETNKAALFVKNHGNHLEQTWIPKSAIKGDYVKDGNMQDIEIMDWFLEMIQWAPFEVKKR